MNQDKSSNKLSLVCGIIGIFGCISVIIADIIGIIVVEKHNPISETISALAITKSAWIQDTGLNLYAAAMIACAIGLYAWNLEGVRWKIAAVLLGLLGIDIILIAEHNQYAGRPGVGAAIHIYCVYAFTSKFWLASSRSKLVSLQYGNSNYLDSFSTDLLFCSY